MPPRATAMGLLPTGIFAALMVEPPSLGTSWILALGRSEISTPTRGKRPAMTLYPASPPANSCLDRVQVHAVSNGEALRHALPSSARCAATDCAIPGAGLFTATTPGRRLMRPTSAGLNATEISRLYVADIVPQDGLVAEFLLNTDTADIPIDSAKETTEAFSRAAGSPSSDFRRRQSPTAERPVIRGDRLHPTKITPRLS